MVGRTLRSTTFLMTLAAFGPHAGAAGPPDLVPPRVSETQLTFWVGHRKGRGTVIAAEGRELTAVTTAEMISANDVGRLALISPKAGHLFGRVLSVTQHPRYEAPGQETPLTLRQFKG